MACHRADPGHQRRAIEVNIGAALSEATGDHVAAAWDDGVGKGHAGIVGNRDVQVACRGQIFGTDPARNIVVVCSGSHDKKVNLGEVFLTCHASQLGL